MARTRHKLHIFDLWPLSVTLTFDIESWVLNATRLHNMVNISTKFHEDTAINYEVRARTSHKLHIFDLWPLSVTLTFDIESWVLYATRLHNMVNISTKFHEDTTITYEVMARTSHKLHIFDLWPLSVTLTFDIESWVLYATRLHNMVNISTKFHEDTTITYEVMARTSHKLHIFDLWPLSVTLTFDIKSWVLYATRLHNMVNISTKFHEHTIITYEVMARTRHTLHIFDLWPLSVTLTFDIESWVLYATRLLIIINILTKLYENATITFEVTARTSSDGRTHARTDARTYTQKLQIVATMSRSPQAGSTKTV